MPSGQGGAARRDHRPGRSDYPTSNKSSFPYLPRRARVQATDINEEMKIADAHASPSWRAKAAEEVAAALRAQSWHRLQHPRAVIRGEEVVSTR